MGALADARLPIQVVWNLLFFGLGFANTLFHQATDKVTFTLSREKITSERYQRLLELHLLPQREADRRLVR